MKKRLSLLSLLLVCTMAAMAQAIKIGSLYYNLDAHYSTAEVKEDPDLTKYSGAIEIPSKVALNENYYSVTYIGPWAFHECSELTSIKIPNSITGIGEYSFQGCTGLTELEIPSSVTTLYGSFSGCTGLKNVTLPNTLTSIGYQTFSNCTGLNSIEIPNSVTTIDGAFIGCTGLKSIEIPNSVTTLNNEAFKDCTGLTNVKISNSVQKIGVRVFEGCTGLTSIEIPNSVTSIGVYAFADCTGLTSIEIPNSVTSIEYGAFCECAGLTSITMQSATPPTMDNGLFYGCSNLETIYVPAGAAEAYNVAPWNAYNIVELVEIINPMLVDGLYYNVDVENKTAEVVAALNDTKYSGDIVVPASISINGIEFAVTAIGSWAFSYCSNLTSIEIPNSVTEIGECAFSQCYGPTSIEIPNSVTEIGERAFSGCSSLTSIVVEEGNSYYDSRENCNAIIETSSNTLVAGCQNTIIPNSVTAIGSWAFSYCSGLTSIEIPNSVTSIGSWAFYYCSNLTSIEIPNSVTEIGKGAFEDCSNLTSIEIPNSVTEIGERAFAFCSGLTSIVVEEGNSYYDSRENCNAIIETASNKLVAGCQNTVIPNSVISIGDYAFFGCSSLTSIEIPNSVTEIGSSAFSLCSRLTSIEIPNSVTSIGDDAFYECDGLTSIEIPNSVTSIGESAFEGCSGLTSIVVEEGNSYYDSRENCNAIIETSSNTLVAGFQNTVIPNSVTSIGDDAFHGCSRLTSIEIPNSVTEIGSSAFSLCSRLTSIEIPNSVTSIGERAFYDCYGLMSITMQRATPPTVGNYLFDLCSKLETIYVPAGAAEAYNVAPWNAYNIVEQVEIINPMLVDGLYYNVDVENKTAEVVAAPNDTKYSGDIVVPASISINGIEFAVTSIEQSAFSYCSGLTSIEIPNSVTEIGGDAFYYCSGLTSIEIPNSVTAIGERAFAFCSGLTSIVVEEGNSYYDSRDNCNAIIETASNTLIVGCQNTIIPSSVTSIGYGAFWNCSGLSNIEIPNSVKEIGDYAFYLCSGLKDIEIPNSVTSIGDWAFNACRNLTHISIPNSVTEIGDDAFVLCSSLTSIEIPNSVTFLGKAVFARCSSLTMIVVEEGNSNYDSRDNCNAIIETASNTLIAGCRNTVIPYSVTSIGEYAFNECTGLSSIEIPNTVTEIGNCAFEGCYHLTHIGIPNSVAEIGESVFAYCHGLKSIEIPNSVMSIGTKAFAQCSGLTSVIMQSTTPPTVGISLFDECGKLETIYVPTGAVEAYNVAPWNEYRIVANYEPRHNGTKTREDRNVIAVKLIGEYSGEQVYSLTSAEQSQDYTDVTNSIVFKVASGEMLTPVVEHECYNMSGFSWMHHAVYIDTDRNGFTGAISEGSEWKPAGDLVSYSFYNNGADSDISGWNSVGEAISGDNIHTLPIPVFTAPTEPGIYRMRFVQDWCSIDPAGDADGKFGDFKENGGQIVDVMLEVLNHVYLTDGEAYTNATEQETERITYTREFKNTQWQSWYVPFDMDYNDISDEYTVACLNDIHEYDDDEDGILDRWTMEVLMLRPGETIYANLPYVIRAKAVGEKQFVVENTMLYPADEQSMDCSSMRMLYTFRGVYSPLEAQVLRDNGWLAMGGGRLVTPTVNSTLKANRWYMESTPRGGYATQYEAPKRIELVVVDENGEVTGIEELPLTEDKNAVWPADVYDLNGRLVKAQAKNLNELPKGVYIVRGEKIVK